MIQEFSDFLNWYFTILTEQVNMIDKGKSKLGNIKFLNCSKYLIKY